MERHTCVGCSCATFALLAFSHAVIKLFDLNTLMLLCLLLFHPVENLTTSQVSFLLCLISPALTMVQTSGKLRAARCHASVEHRHAATTNAGRNEMTFVWCTWRDLL